MGGADCDSWQLGNVTLRIAHSPQPTMWRRYPPFG